MRLFLLFLLLWSACTTNLRSSVALSCNRLSFLFLCCRSSRRCNWDCDWLNRWWWRLHWDCNRLRCLLLHLNKHLLLLLLLNRWRHLLRLDLHLVLVLSLFLSLSLHLLRLVHLLQILLRLLIHHLERVKFHMLFLHCAQFFLSIVDVFVKTEVSE